MNIFAFIDSVLDQKRKAEAYGMKLDIVCLPYEVADRLLKASEVHNDVVFDPDKQTVTIHGVHVMWSKGRLRGGRTLLRLTNPNFKEVSNG